MMARRENDAGQPISRVLYFQCTDLPKHQKLVAIYLGPKLLSASSNLPESQATRAASLAAPKHCDSPLFDLASGGVYLAAQVALDAGELLPHRFTLT